LRGGASAGPSQEQETGGASHLTGFQPSLEVQVGDFMLKGERNMDELITLISERTGIDRAQAQTAIELVLTHLQERLPEPIASQLRGVLEGSTSSGDVADKLKGLQGGLGGLFGR
jgi:hypothetical protein